MDDTSIAQLGAHEARLNALEKDVDAAHAAIRQVEQTEIANMAIIQKDISTMTTNVAVVAESVKNLTDKVQEHDEKFDKIMDKLDKLQDGQIDFRITKGKIAFLGTVGVMAIGGLWEILKFVFENFKH